MTRTRTTARRAPNRARNIGTLLLIALAFVLGACSQAAGEPVSEQAPVPTCSAGTASPSPGPEPIEDGSYRDGAESDC